MSKGPKDTNNAPETAAATGAAQSDAGHDIDCC